MATFFVILSFALFVYYSSSYEMNDLIAKLNGYDKKWKSGFNAKFSSLSYEETKRFMGTNLPIDPLDKLPQKQIQALQNIPESFDSRQFWPRCQSIKQVRDQSTCGSCWAFAAVQSMSDRICISSGQKQQTRISARDVLSCCGLLTCGRGCEGGNPNGAWQYFKNTGISTQKCQPYPFPPCDHHTTGRYQPCGKIQPTPKCQKKCQTPDIDFKNDLHFGKMVYSIPSRVSDIQTEILTNGPVEASFKVYEDFLTYKSGVYHHVTGSSLGGHSVKIIGWGVQENTPYWLVANSWNEDWGDKGFFKIKRGNDECGIEKDIVAGIPIIKSQIDEQ